MTRTPAPITDDAGHMRPDLDFRLVPRATMAQYLGVHPDTLHQMVLRGVYTKGVVKVGRVYRYQPRQMVGVQS